MNVGARDAENTDPNLNLSREAISQESLAMLKGNLVKLVMHSPNNVSKHYSQITELIARDQFSLNWPELFPQLVQTLSETSEMD